MYPALLCLRHASVFIVPSACQRAGRLYQLSSGIPLSRWLSRTFQTQSRAVCTHSHIRRTTCSYPGSSRLALSHGYNCQMTAFFPTGLSPRTDWRFCIHRNHGHYERENPQQKKELRSTLFYISALGIFMVGMAYAGVPLYQMFCQQVGLGGQAKEGHDSSKVETMTPIKERVIRVRFSADTTSSMQWNFRPEQSEVKVVPGETALAFYKAKNPTDKPIIGISTYNILPYAAGLYFNKIQCFCFEEQRLNPKEEVDMPVFFFIDPEFTKDPALEGTSTITLSYTFFEAKDGMSLPLPGFISGGQ